MRLLLHSSAAYASDPSGCLSPRLPSFVVSHTFNASLYGTSLFGYAGVDDAQQLLVFAFQGSMDAGQLWEELLHDAPLNVTADGELLVNQYFYAGSVGLLADVSAAYSQLTARYANYTAHFTGHSLGGALAHVLSYLLASSLSAPSVAPAAAPLLYTFGQPRTGNAAFAASSSLYVPCHFRVVHWRDVIPHLPPCPTQRGPGGDVCSAANATAGYYAYHALEEVWYQSAMPQLALQRQQWQEAGLPSATTSRAAPSPPPPPPAWTTCSGEPSGEDETCSDGMDWWWIEDHYYYYQVEVGDLCTSPSWRDRGSRRVDVTAAD